MDSKKLAIGRSLFTRAEHDSEIIYFITELAKKNKIKTASFTAIGALKNAKLGSMIKRSMNIQNLCFRLLKKFPAAQAMFL